jgi:hypothetical protein
MDFWHKPSPFKKSYLSLFSTLRAVGSQEPIPILNNNETCHTKCYALRGEIKENIFQDIKLPVIFFLPFGFECSQHCGNSALGLLEHRKQCLKGGNQENNFQDKNLLILLFHPLGLNAANTAEIWP